MKKVFSHSLKFLCLVSAGAMFGLGGCQYADFGEFCGEINGVPFYQMDTNRDKWVSREEFTPKASAEAVATSNNFGPNTTVGCTQRHADFDQVDGDHNGFISELEFDTFQNKVVVE